MNAKYTAFNDKECGPEFAKYLNRLERDRAALLKAAKNLVRWLEPWAQDYSPNEAQMRDLEKLRAVIAKAERTP